MAISKGTVCYDPQLFEITLSRNEKDISVENKEDPVAKKEANCGMEGPSSSARAKYEHCVLAAYGVLPAIIKGINCVYGAKREMNGNLKEARKEEPSVGIFMSRGRHPEISDRHYEYAVLKAYGIVSFWGSLNAEFVCLHSQV